MPLTYEERERIAYANNDPQASLLGELADVAKQTEAIDNALDYLAEAKGCFPAEDVLQPVMALLRKSKAAVARDALELLDEIANELRWQAEYGREQLGKAIDELET